MNPEQVLALMSELKTYENAFNVWLDEHPEASETAKQNKRVELWKKWRGDR